MTHNNRGTLNIAEEIAKHVDVIGFSLYHIEASGKYYGKPHDIKEWLPIIKATAGTTQLQFRNLLARS